MYIYQTKYLICERFSLDVVLELRDFYLRNLEHLAPWDPIRPSNYFEENIFFENAKKQIDEQTAGRAERIVIRRDNQIIGLINFTNISPVPFLACNLGYSIDQTEQGKGMMTEALHGALNYIFCTKRLHRIMANYLPKNRRSAAVLRRLGFAVEGYARSYLMIAGRWEDHVLTALSEEDAQLMPWFNRAQYSDKL
jgi:[ribosomal protein S5]-alanine N-acetyltransferase